MDEEFKIKGYFAVQEKMLELGGLSLKENQSVLYKLYCLTLYCLYTIYLIIVVHDIVVNLDDFSIVVDSIYHGMAVLMVIFKIWIIAINRKKFRKNLDMFEQAIFRPNLERGGPIEEIWIKQCIRYTNRLTIAGCGLALINICFSISASMTKRIINKDSQQWQQPFNKFSIFKPYSSPNFELAWLYQSIGYIFIGFIYLGTDFLVATIFAHISLQYKILRNSIKRMVPNTLQGQLKDTKEGPSGAEALQGLKQLDYDRLKNCVLHHVAIMELAQQCEDVLTTLIFGFYCSLALALACMMYHGSLYPPLDSRFQKDITMGIAVLFQPFLMSYFANEVALESDMVIDTCFDPEFFGIDIAMQKSLWLIMIRSQKPIKFTIGKLADLSLESFVALVRMSYSYYMVMHSMNQ